MVDASTKTQPTSPGRRPFWQSTASERLDAFAWLRQHEPIAFHEASRGQAGFWSVTRLADAQAVNRDAATFSSAHGFTFEDMPKEQAKFVGSMIALDNPEHSRLRKLVQGVFTVRAVRGLREALEQRASTLFDRIEAQGSEFDFVTDIANEYPLQVICELLGVPDADRLELRNLVDRIVGAGDAEFQEAGDPAASLQALYQYALDLGRERRSGEHNDITSRLMRAEIDGERLSERDFGSFMILLVGAGIDTTRSSLAWAFKLLSDHPDQRRYVLEDWEARSTNAIEEVLRWSSPVVHMRRTASRDAMIGDIPITEGDKVVIWYLSINHDEHVFVDPRRFDVTRDNARENVAFGAGGPHFCLGASLARLEMQVLLRQLYTRFPHARSTAEPAMLVSPFVNGVKSLPGTIVG